MTGYVFYDTETTGTLTAYDQILQFGAIRTDGELNELERFEIRCRLMPHIVPAPMGVVGIRIHGLKNLKGFVSTRGKNPFQFIGYGDTGKKLSSIVKCYDPAGSNSKERYSWISKRLANIIEGAIKIREAN